VCPSFCSTHIDAKSYHHQDDKSLALKMIEQEEEPGSQAIALGCLRQALCYRRKKETYLLTPLWPDFY